jgi:hypothetical protein
VNKPFFAKQSASPRETSALSLYGPFLLIAALGALMWGACSATAAPVLLNRFNGGSIGTSFAHPTGLAVDQSTPAVSGNVFIADGGTHQQVDALGPEGEAPLGGISASQLTDSFNFAEEPAGLAIDGSAGASNGDLYVDDVENNLIKKFRLAGSGYEYVCEIAGFGSGCLPEAGTPTQKFIEPVGLAVDSHGNVYVSDFGNQVVDEFSETGADIRQIKGKGIALGFPSGLALDAQGDLYVQQYEGGKVLRFAANLLGEVEPETEPTVLDAGPAFAVAVDQNTGKVYVAHAKAVAQFSANGTLEGEFGSGAIGSASGIAVNSTSESVYVADAAHDDVAVFGAAPVQPPRIDSEYVRNVSPGSALLTAQVNARGFDTHAYFEYGTDTSYASGRTPAAPGIDIGSGGALEPDQTVEAIAQGLTPGTVYHYRAVAVNSNGEVADGSDHLFMTLPPAGSAQLPDGRALEMVSPPEKNNGDILGANSDSGGGMIQAAPEGNGIAFVSFAAFGGAPNNSGGNQYLARRTITGWSTQSLGAPMNAQTYHISSGAPYRAFSLDLSSGLLLNGSTVSGRHGVENPPLPGSGAPAGYENYYLNTFANEGFQALINEALTNTTLHAPPDEFEMEFVGATPDLSRVVVASSAALTPEVTEEQNISRLYEWAGGQFHLLSALPSGTPDNREDIRIGSGLPDQRAVSSDGSRVIWTAAGEGGGLYVREGVGTPQVRTVQLDAARGGPESGGGTFLTAGSNGQKVFFADSRQLTATASPGGEGLGALYEFKLEAGNPEGGQLIDLTPNTSGAAVQGVLGEGESAAGGAYVYFVAGGVLATGASAGADNLYVLHEDPSTHGWTTTFVRTLSPDDSRNETNSPAPGEAQDWTFDAAVRTTRVTPDGTHLLFMSNANLTGYDNTLASGAGCGNDTFGNPLPVACEEVFVYDAPSGSLSCASCNPTGERPAGPSGVRGGTDFSPGRGIYQARAISEDGSRVFFESYDGLVSQDTNGRRDVYEYEAGHPYLLSGGSSDTNASFVDASANGNDAFFITRAALVPQDGDALVDLYDARAPHAPGEAVGFSAREAPVPCAEEAMCRAPATPATPPISTPSSTTFSGPASVSAAPPQAVVRKAKTKKRHKAEKRKKKGRRATSRRVGRAHKTSKSARR